MSEIVTDCPRCKARHMTFDVRACVPRKRRHDWQGRWEAFGVCRACDRPSIFIIAQKSSEDTAYLREHDPLSLIGALHHYVNVEGFVNISDLGAQDPPEYLPKAIEEIFREGAKCTRVECYNAAATMFRLCVDLATKPLLPAGPTPGLNTRRDETWAFAWSGSSGTS
ncbi:MAG TPA: hypothetical protein VFB63_26015 [Bryobacteraceae bacterium]|nr:hypothetical protein [Bryobacteraceae bacterium]